MKLTLLLKGPIRFVPLLKKHIDTAYLSILSLFSIFQAGRQSDWTSKPPKIALNHPRLENQILVNKVFLTSWLLFVNPVQEKMENTNILHELYNVKEELVEQEQEEDYEKNCALSEVDGRHIMIPFSQTSHIFIVLLLYPSNQL